MVWGCNGGDNNFSGNVNPTLNVTGNYEVKRTPNAALKNFTFTQTHNRVQAVDNEGVSYTGTTSGDITTTDVDGTHTVTTSATLQGTDASGVVRTIVITTITYLVKDPFSDPSTTTDAASAISIIGLAGTYTDTAGKSGAIEMVGNSLQPDDTF